MPSQVRLGYRRSDTPALFGRNWTFLESQPQSRSLVLHLRPESIEVRYCLQETTRNFQHPIDRSGNPDAGRSKSMWLENQRAHCRLNSLMPTSWYIYFISKHIGYNGSSCLLFLLSQTSKKIELLHRQRRFHRESQKRAAPSVQVHRDKTNNGPWGRAVNSDGEQESWAPGETKDEK